MATPEVFPTKQSDDFGTVLGNTFRLIRVSWQALLTNINVVLLVYILPYVLFIGLMYAISPDLLAGKYNEADFEKLNIPLAAAGAVGIAILVTILSIASVHIQFASVADKKISFSEVIERSWPFFWRFIGLGLLVGVIILAGIILLLIPGLLAAFFLSFAIYVMVDQDLGVVASIKGSYRLVRANWKLVLSYLIVTFVIGIPGIVPIIGDIVSAVLAIAYFCLPAILYRRMVKPVGAPTAPTT